LKFEARFFDLISVRSPGIFRPMTIDRAYPQLFMHEANYNSCTCGSGKDYAECCRDSDTASLFRLTMERDNCVPAIAWLGEEAMDLFVIARPSPLCGAGAVLELSQNDLAASGRSGGTSVEGKGQLLYFFDLGYKVMPNPRLERLMLSPGNWRFFANFKPDRA